MGEASYEKVPKEKYGKTRVAWYSLLYRFKSVPSLLIRVIKNAPLLGIGEGDTFYKWKFPL